MILWRPFRVGGLGGLICNSSSRIERYHEHGAEQLVRPCELFAYPCLSGKVRGSLVVCPFQKHWTRPRAILAAWSGMQ
jgi:hypothetical protein